MDFLARRDILENSKFILLSWMRILFHLFRCVLCLDDEFHLYNKFPASNFDILSLQEARS